MSASSGDLHHGELLHRVNFPDQPESTVQPFHLYPAGDGLVPWGGTDNGDVLYWHKGIREPERWPIVCYSMRDGDHSTFNLSATEFLVSLLSKQIVVPQFPEDWFTFEGPAEFTPYCDGPDDN